MTISANSMIKKIKVGNQEVSLVSLEHFEPEFQFDIRYARTDNFVKKAVYAAPQAFLLEHVAQDLRKVHLALKSFGFGLLIYDGYRPWSVTKLFWDLSSEHDRQFLADPKSGSSHNRGCAIDLSMIDHRTQKPVEMPSDFDEMNEKSYIDFEGGTARARELRDLLRSTMHAHNFTGIKNEWWHFNHKTAADWPIMNVSFEEILQAP